MLRLICMSDSSRCEDSGSASLGMVAVGGAVELAAGDKVREILCCIFGKGEWLYRGVLGSISLLVLEGSICSWPLDDLGAESAGCP